jgi:hypothetical protein
VIIRSPTVALARTLTFQKAEKICARRGLEFDTRPVVSRAVSAAPFQVVIGGLISIDKPRDARGHLFHDLRLISAVNGNELNREHPARPFWGLRAPFQALPIRLRFFEDLTITAGNPIAGGSENT